MTLQYLLMQEFCRKYFAYVDAVWIAVIYELIIAHIGT